MRTYHQTLFSLKTYILIGSFFLTSQVVKAQEGEDSVVIQDSMAVTGTDLSRDSIFAKVDTAIRTDSVPYYYRINGAYLKMYPKDLKHIVTSPFRWQGRDWLKFGIITGTAGVLMFTADRPLREFIVEHQDKTLQGVSKVMYPFGNRLPPVLLAGLYATSLVTKNRRLEHTTLAATKSLAISTIIYTSSKALIRRQRPTRTDDPLNFVAPFTKKGFTSFPSGHANTAFSVATAFALHYKDVKWVPWAAYTLATLTSLSRLYDDRHWASDVLLGASVGHFITRAIYKLDEKRQNAGRADLKVW